MEGRAGHTGSEKWVHLCIYVLLKFWVLQCRISKYTTIRYDVLPVVTNIYLLDLAENITHLGPHTLQLQVLLGDTSASSSIKSLPCHRIKFTVTGVLCLFFLLSRDMTLSGDIVSKIIYNIVLNLNVEVLKFCRVWLF